MPGNNSFTDFSFRREVLAGSTGLSTIGPLRVPVPRELWRRRVYFGIIWSGFSDWVAEGELTFWDGGAVQERLRSRWGTVFGASGASSVTWGTGSQTWRASSPGFPSSVVQTWQPPAALPNQSAEVGCLDSLTLYGVQRPDGVNAEASRMTLYPWEHIGPMEEIRFEFQLYTPTTLEVAPTVEVFLGVKSFKV